MTEAFLHYLFDKRKLGNHFVTTEGHALVVSDFGKLNLNAGPDFSESIIQFDNKTWAGHIEFHIKSSDWIKHKHQNDKAYNNVIAHFVWKHDREITINKFTLPVVELSGLIDEDEYKKYSYFIKNRTWIPCANSIKNIDAETVRLQIKQSVEQRFERKSNEVLALLDKNNGDQLRTKMSLLAKSLGGKVNGETMVQLISKVLPHHLSKIEYNEFRIQALLHGLSGLLEETNNEDTYQSKLKVEFNYLKALFDLVPMSKEEWKWSSLRPAGSPTIRIAQFAGILSQSNGQYNALKFDELVIDDFWTTHYNFDRATKPKSYQLSQGIKDSIEINATIPFEMAIQKLSNNEKSALHAIEGLKAIRPEKNAIVENWNVLGVESNSAFETQGLIEQKNRLCNEKKCLFCAIGKQVLHP